MSRLDQEFTLNAHQDSGAMERWEDPSYRACYQKIFEGKWDEYDPWNADHRSNAKTDLYSTGSKSRFWPEFPRSLHEKEN